VRGGVVVPPPLTPTEWLRDRTFALTGAPLPSKNDPRGDIFLRGDPQAVPVLAELVGDPDPRVRYWAADGLQCVTPPARDAVPALLAALRRYGNEGEWERVNGDGGDQDVLSGIVTRIDDAAATGKIRSALEAIEPEAANRAAARVGGGARDEHR
jgi:hypothetical protein